jgi:hypothetical protein
MRLVLFFDYERKDARIGTVAAGFSLRRDFAG